MEYPRVAEVAYTTLDWMTKHRATIGQTDDLWKHVTSLFPQDNELIPWSKIMAITKAHRKQTVEKMECCVNMCVIYNWEPTHPLLKDYKLHQGNSHRTSCPVCKEERYALGVPRREFFYLPMKEWLQDLYKREDLIPLMQNDIAPTMFPSGLYIYIYIYI